MFSELSRIVDQISRDKGIEKELLIEGLEEAVMQAARKKFGLRRDMEVRYNEELGEIELFQFRTVVETVEDEQTEISMKDAIALDPDVELGDDIGSKMDDVADLGRIAAQSAKQVIIQRMKDAESDVVYEMYKTREGEIINGIVQRFERGNLIVNLGRTDAILPASQQMPRRSYRQGDRIINSRGLRRRRAGCQFCLKHCNLRDQPVVVWVRQFNRSERRDLPRRHADL